MSVTVYPEPTADFFLEVARGNVPGMSAVQKFGRNADIDTAAAEDIWAGGGTRVYLSSAETMDVASTSTNDDGSPAGTGLQKLMIEGLDGSYAEVSEEVTLDGTGTVTTSQSFLRINRAYGTDVGSVESNDGDITIDPTTSGSGSRQAFVATGDGQTLIGHYTVPAAKTAYMVGGQMSIGGTTGGSKEARLKMLIREGANKCWRVQSDWGLSSGGTSIAPDIVFSVPISIAAQSDIRWVGTALTNNIEIYVQYNLILVDN